MPHYVTKITYSVYYTAIWYNFFPYIYLFIEGYVVHWYWEEKLLLSYVLGFHDFLSSDVCDLENIGQEHFKDRFEEMLLWEADLIFTYGETIHVSKILCWNKINYVEQVLVQV